MSQNHNRELSSWKTVLARLRRTEVMWRGEAVSEQDHASYTEAILMCGMVLSDLSNQYPGCGTRRDHVLWCVNATDTDVSELAAFLPDAIKILRDYYLPGSMTLAGFKRQLGLKHPRAGLLLAPVQVAISAFLADPSPDTLYAPYQFFSYLTHLSLQDIDLSKELEDAFIANEERISQHHAPEFIVSRLREVMQEWLSSYSLTEENFSPKHGKGAVADLRGRASLLRKYSVLAPDQRMTTIFRMCAHIELDTYVPTEADAVTTRQARLVFVPKSMKTQRAISEEPTTLMYFQQGVKHTLHEYFRRHPILSKHVDLEDQDVQQEWALYASSTGDMATVDLSAASDSVSWDLVKRVFRGTRLYPYLLALRSETVLLTTGRVLTVAKFAPMGSALCFPIQTLIFAGLAEVTARYVGQTTGHHDHRFRVYGDDIIIPSPHLEDMASNLRLCGFTLNEDKTYGHPYRFRESCGLDCYDGTDISPMKIGRRFLSGALSVRSVGSFARTCTAANSAAAYGYSLLRSYLIDSLVNGSEWVPPFSLDGMLGIQSDSPTNYRLPRRWNEDYHRMEILAACVTSIQSQSCSLKWDHKRNTYVFVIPNEYHEEARLYEWFRLAERRNGDPLADSYLVVSRIGSVGSQLSKCWIVETDAGR